MMKKLNFKKLLIGTAVGLVIVGAITSGAIADRLFGIKPLDKIFPRQEMAFKVGTLQQKILIEESVVIDVAEKVSPSVVTVSIQSSTRRILEFSPFGGFRPRIEGGEPRDIGTGFIVSESGLVITNKHVVVNKEAKYKVITKDDKEYEVKEISRDPLNDIAILKIGASGLKAVELGDSGNLKVGQFVMAIGTALGELRHTVTTGVISGLGRGITAGNPFEGFVERLDNVIQTDAAINPGNSGGPLVNSAGQVIGVNVALAQGAENIGFAIPINVVKDGLERFEKEGKFPSKAFLGVQYQMIPQRTAIINNVPQGAYVVDVIADTPAEAAGVEVDDIITKFDKEELTEEKGLAELIIEKSPGDKVTLEVWRDGETLELTTTLTEFSE